MRATDRYAARALADAVSTFAYLSLDGFKLRASYYHLAWGLPDDALEFAYALWLRRFGERSREAS